MMRFIVYFLMVFLGVASSGAKAETTACTEIAAVPVTITVQGVYCLKKHLATAASSGAAITIANHHVTIDFNGFKLGGLGGGSSSTAIGVLSTNASFVSIRNGAIKGFRTGISLNAGNNILVENMQVDGSLDRGIDLSDVDMSILRRNSVTNTGTPTSEHNYGIVATGTSANRSNIITENLVSGVFANYFGVGIATQNSRKIEISRNSVTNITGGSTSTLGIYVFPTLSGYPSSEVRAVIRHNTLFNTGTGFGIAIEGGTAVCTDNSIVGFASALVTCFINARNDVM